MSQRPKQRKWGQRLSRNNSPLVLKERSRGIGDTPARHKDQILVKSWFEKLNQSMITHQIVVKLLNVHFRQQRCAIFFFRFHLARFQLSITERKMPPSVRDCIKKQQLSCTWVRFKNTTRNQECSLRSQQRWTVMKLLWRCDPETKIELIENKSVSPHSNQF